MIDPLAREPGRMLFRRFRRNRTQVYNQASRPNTLRGTEFEKHAFDHRPVFENHAYDIGLGHGISRGLSHFGPEGRKRVGLGCGAVPNGEIMPSRDEVLCHGAAHKAGAEEGNLRRH